MSTSSLQKQQQKPKFALIIGGTGFISQYCVEELHNAGFIVATMNRGSSFDLHGDKVSHRFIVNCRKRKEFVQALENSIKTMTSLGFEIENNSWDLVIDFICYEPPRAQDCCIGLNGICKLFILISTDSIYEVCTRPSYLDLPTTTATATDSIPNSNSNNFTTSFINTPHPGRREEDQELLPVSDKELRKKDEYGLEKLQCEQIFYEFSQQSLHQLSSQQKSSHQSQFPFESVWLRLPDVTGERELPRSRHFQLQMRIQLGLPIYIDPESNKYDVDEMNLPMYYDPPMNFGNNGQNLMKNDHFSVINNLPPPHKFPPDAVKLSFVHARDVSTAALACYWLQQLARDEKITQNTQYDDAQSCPNNPHYAQMANSDHEIPSNTQQPSTIKSNYQSSWSKIVNSGVHVGSLEQVTLLEYLYLIGNTLEKPVFVYSSHQGREYLLKQRIKTATDVHYQNKNDKNDNKSDNTNIVSLPQDRIYPKSYHQLYLEYRTSHFDITTGETIAAYGATAPSSPSEGLEKGRANLQFFSRSKSNTPNTPNNSISTQSITPIQLKQLETITLNNTIPREEYRSCSQHDCLDCQKWLPNEKKNVEIDQNYEKNQKNDHNSSQSSSPRQQVCSPWQSTESTSEFLGQLFAAGYTCPYESSSDDSDSDSTTSSSEDDSDYDQFFTGSFAKSICNPVFENISKNFKNSSKNVQTSRINQDEMNDNCSDLDLSKMSRKAKISIIIKRTLGAGMGDISSTSTTTTTTTTAMSDSPSQSPPLTKFDSHNLNHLRVLHLLERLETSDQCSYLPSVTQGPISIQKALDHLPGWAPMCLYAWASKQSVWYSTPVLMNAMEADPRNELWKLEDKWGKYL